METDIHCFEQPINERIRTFLRLEHLIARLRYHEQDKSVWGRRATMDSLLDILNVMSRHDVRGEVTKELGRCYANLESLAEHSAVDTDKLQRLLEQVDGLGYRMQQVPPQFASYQIRDHELLNNLNNRSAIPGGSCSFDLPAYQHWLSQPDAHIEADIARWCIRIEPFEHAISLLLQLLRDSADAEALTAEGGVLVHNTESNTQLIRVLLDDASVYPEISAGRHRSTIRFMMYRDDRLHVQQTQRAIRFRMASCRF